jgi:tetrahedral aminopeptidase
MIETLKELSGLFGVSGSETQIKDWLMNKVRGKVDLVHTDAMGNLICVKKGSGEKVMLAAHMDEIGLIATYVEEKGFVRVSKVGGVSLNYAMGQRVRFENGTFGVLHHEEKLDHVKDLHFSSTYVDVGANSKEEALQKIQIGEMACFYSEPAVEGDYLMAKALDNRAGVLVLLKVMENLPKTDKEVYFAFTVQEEVGLRGAKTVAFGCMPDVSITVDITRTGDTPAAKPMEISCGKGPAIKIKDQSVICHKEVIKRLRSVCEEKNIAYQNEILESGGTDAGAIHLTGGGIPSGGVSIPCRYIHTPNEMVHKKDLEDAVALIVGFLEK